MNNTSEQNDLILDDVIKTLSEALAADPYALQRLFRHRVECNVEMADHPHIVTGSSSQTTTLSTLGLINGIVSSLTEHRVALMISGDSDALIGFTKYIPTKN